MVYLQIHSNLSLQILNAYLKVYNAQWIETPHWFPGPLNKGCYGTEDFPTILSRKENKNCLQYNLKQVCYHQRLKKYKNSEFHAIST
jgi:hypothetical protein